MTKAIIVSLAVAIIGCGGSNGGGSAGSGGGGGTGSGGSGGTGVGGNGSDDMAMSLPHDMAHGGSFMCGSMSCAPGTECCVVGTTPSCASSCPDGGVVVSCSGPADCSNGACCIKIGANFSVHTVECTPYDQCVPNVTLAGGVDRACVTDSDCTTDGKGGNDGTMFKDCCTNTQLGRKACFSKALGLPGWTCP
jgi:hypothetical protein